MANSHLSFAMHIATLLYLTIKADKKSFLLALYLVESEMTIVMIINS